MSTTPRAIKPAEIPPTQLLPLAAAAITILLWASAFVAIRTAGRQITPGALSLGRLLIGSVVLGCIALRAERSWPERRDWPRLVLCGVAWFGIYNVALNAAERHMDAGLTAMIVNVGPILIAVLAGLLLGEGFPPMLLVGSVVAFSGVAVIGISSSSSAHADLTGLSLCLVAAVGYAVGVVSQKPLLDHLSGLTVTWVACTVGAISCLPFASALIHDVSGASTPAIAAMVYLGALPTAVGFTLWAYALRQTSAGRMGTTTLLVPPVAILLGWLLLGEVPAPFAAAGGTLCIAGVWISRRRPSPKVVIQQ